MKNKALFCLLLIICFTQTAYSIPADSLIQKENQTITPADSANDKTTDQIKADSSMVKDTSAVAEAKSEIAPMPEFGQMVLNLLGAFALVIFLIYGITYFMKKLSRQGKLVNNLDSGAKILDIFPLNNKQAVYIVSLFDEVYILGITEDSIHLIDKIEDKEKIAKIMEQASRKSNLSFSKILQAFGKK